MDSRTVCLCSAAFRRICSRMMSAFSLSTRPRALASASIRRSSFLCLSSISCSIVAVENSPNTTNTFNPTLFHSIWPLLQQWWEAYLFSWPPVSVLTPPVCGDFPHSELAVGEQRDRFFMSYTLAQHSTAQEMEMEWHKWKLSTKMSIRRRPYLLPKLVFITLSGQFILILSSLQRTKWKWHHFWDQLIYIYMFPGGLHCIFIIP